MTFLYWLASIFKKKDPGCADCKIDLREELTQFQILKNLAKEVGAPEAAVDQLISYYNQNVHTEIRYWAVADFRTHSSNKRLFVFDTLGRTVQSYFVAHGKGSDPEFSGWCKTFSNVPNSLSSSKGIYRCSETYISASFGYALRLDGLEKTNSNARARGIVFHGCKYAEDAYIEKMGKTGRSEGCPAVGFQYSKDLIDKLKNGSLLNIWGGN